MGHAVIATWIPAATIMLPVRGLDQLLVAFCIAVGHQIAGFLPAEDRVAGNAPGRAREIDLAFQEVKERGEWFNRHFERGRGESFAEDLPGTLDAQEMVLIGGLFVGIAGRDLHGVDAQIVVEEVQYGTYAGRISCERTLVGSANTENRAASPR